MKITICLYLLIALYRNLYISLDVKGPFVLQEYGFHTTLSINIDSLQVLLADTIEAKRMRR